MAVELARAGRAALLAPGRLALLSGGGIAVPGTLAITAVSPLVGGALSTATLTFAGGAPASLAVAANGTPLAVVGTPAITVLSGSGNVAAGAASVRFAAPSGASTITVSSGGPFAATSPAFAAAFSAAVAFNIPFTLTNGAASAVAAPVFSANHQFGAGAIPAGSHPAVFDAAGNPLAACQVDSTRAWEADGSLRRAVISTAYADAFDAYGGAAQTHAYTVKAVPGSAPGGAPKVTLADIAAQDIKVAFSGFDCGTDTLQVSLRDIIANAAPGVHVASLTTAAAAAAGATVLAFASLSAAIAGSDGVAHNFTATKGMAVHGAGIAAGAAIASVSGNAITLSAPLAGPVAAGATVSFDSPLWGYEVTKAGPVCCEWRFWSRLMRVGDGAVHRWAMGEIYLKAWARDGQWEIRFKASSPNCYGPHPAGTLGAVPPPGLGANTSPIPRFVSVAALMNGSVALQSWGGPGDFRAQAVPAAGFDPATNTVSFAKARLSTAYGYTEFRGVPLTFAAAPGGALPPGLMPGVPYWVGSNDFGASYRLLTSRQVFVDVTQGNNSAFNWVQSANVSGNSYTFSNNVFYYTAAGGMTASSGAGPSGAGTVTDGTITWVCVSVVLGAAGSGQVSVVPVTALYHNTAWVGADPIGNPVWWQGNGALAARPVLLFAPDQNYLLTQSKATPPFDQTTTAYKHTSLDYNFDRGPGVTWQNTYGINSPPAWGYLVSYQGDDPGDERVGDISCLAVRLLRSPQDPRGAQLVRTGALCFTDLPIWFIDERSGFPLVGTMGPGRVALPKGQGSDYPGLGHSDPDYTVIDVNGRFYPTLNTDIMQNCGYVAGYGSLADAQHWPRLWYGPALLDGDPIWQDIGMATAQSLLLGASGGSSNASPPYNDGARHYKNAAGVQYSGLGAGLIGRPRAIAWSTLSQTRVEAFLPDNHPCLPVYRDLVDDIAAAFPDFYANSGQVPAGMANLGLIHNSDLPSPGNRLQEQQYMLSFAYGVWAQEIWKEVDNGRRAGWVTYVNNYLRKAAIDMWDSDLNKVRSEYYMAVGTGYGGAFYASDLNGNYYSSVEALYAGNGWSTAYPNGPPATGIANGDTSIPGGAVQSNGSGYDYGTYAGIGNYPSDTGCYYTLGAYHLAWLGWAGVPKATILAARANARIKGLGGITWSLPNGTGHYDNGNSSGYFTFNLATPPP